MLLLSTGASVYAQGDAKKGEELFKANCTACHALDKQMVGPALGGVVDRLKTEQNLDTDWLHKWIKDNASLRASGDKYANEVYEKFNKTEMLPFPNLTDQDIDDILEYTTNPPAPAPAGKIGASLLLQQLLMVVPGLPIRIQPRCWKLLRHRKRIQQLYWFH